MRPILLVVVSALALALWPAAASAATTANFAIKHGETNYRTSVATTPGAYQAGTTPRQPCPASGLPCTWEAHEFEIKPGEENGAFSVSITWGSADDDWDLYVYKVRPDGSVDEASPVASSASGGTTEETATKLSSPDAPIEPGVYRIYIDNWAAASPDWEGFVAFEPFVKGNTRPVAVLNAPASAASGQSVTLDGSASTDPDGTIADFSWDLDGDGRFEVEGAGPTQQVTLPGGRRHVSLRVRDDRGGVDYATSVVDVALPSGPTRFVEVDPPLGSIRISVKARQAFRQFAIRGVAASVTCPTACEILGSLRISKATARRLGLGRKARTIAVRRRELSGEGSTPRLSLKPGRRVRNAIRRRRPVPAVVRVTVTADGYAPQTFTRRVSITR
ncbi:MAG TPA: PKD domain-containing protein [Solirubrobacteraceae bacterium]|jgi:hypothetical protein